MIYNKYTAYVVYNVLYMLYAIQYICCILYMLYIKNCICFILMHILHTINCTLSNLHTACIVYTIYCV